jgi:hypothetical protein
MSLDAAHVAFESGDFAQARRLASQLLATAPDEPTRSAAADILQRTSIDPLILWITVACAVIFLAIVLATTLG